MTEKKPQKAKNVLELIRECIEKERYTFTKHALDRQNERTINVAEVMHVLKTGNEEKGKTRFDDDNMMWKYAIRGKTKIDKLDVRVIIAFDEDGMLIITVMHVGGI